MKCDHNKPLRYIIHDHCIHCIIQVIFSYFGSKYWLRIQKSRQLSASVATNTREHNGGKEGKYLIIFDQLLSVVGRIDDIPARINFRLGGNNLVETEENYRYVSKLVSYYYPCTKCKNKKKKRDENDFRGLKLETKTSRILEGQISS